MGLRDAKREAAALRLTDLEKLDDWLHERIQALKDEEREGERRPRREVVEVRATATKTYQLERVRCGKDGCKCSSGELHGPYWYAYWKEGGRTRSEYVGKELGE